MTVCANTYPNNTPPSSRSSSPAYHLDNNSYPLDNSQRIWLLSLLTLRVKPDQPSKIIRMKTIKVIAPVLLRNITY